MRRMQAPPPAFPMFLRSLAHCFPAPRQRLLLLHRCQGGACSCCCTSVELALLLLLLLLLLPCSEHHLIQERLQDCFFRCALNNPTSWSNVLDLLPDAGSASYKEEMLAVLAIHLVLGHFQLNDLDMTPLLPFFYWLFELTLFTRKKVLG